MTHIIKKRIGVISNKCEISRISLLEFPRRFALSGWHYWVNIYIIALFLLTSRICRWNSIQFFVCCTGRAELRKFKFKDTFSYCCIFTVYSHIAKYCRGRQVVQINSCLQFLSCNILFACFVFFRCDGRLSFIFYNIWFDKKTIFSLIFYFILSYTSDFLSLLFCVSVV